MKTYKDLLSVLNALTESQLNSDIVILQDGQLINTDVLDVVVDDNPLYEFKDVDMTTYLDFEDDISASEYNCTKLLDSKYPILKL